MPAEVELQLLRRQHVLAVLVELGSGAVEAEHHVLARRVAGGLDGLEDQFEGLFVAREVGRETALVADGRRVAASCRAAS